MQKNGDCIVFEKCDMHFVNRFGFEEAAQMVQDYQAFNTLPFIYDTFQLADFLQLRRKALFELTKRTDRYYYPVEIPKRNGGVRKLQVPAGVLRACQTRILDEILVHFTPSRYATAYKKGARITDNAAPHVGKRYLLKLDIEDFFGSIRFDSVYSTLFNTRRFPRQIGVMLATLCCYKDALPQGAPTSPAISNLVLKQFDEVLGGWCEKHRVTYTRYCDDMTFSSDQPLYHVLEKVRSLLRDSSFELNEKKTRFITATRRQSVTGLTVNEKVSVSRDYKRTLRQEVYYVLRYGPANTRYHTDTPAPLYEGKASDCKHLDILIGKVRFVLSVEPENKWFRTSLEDLMKMQRRYMEFGNEEYVPYYN